MSIPSELQPDLELDEHQAGAVLESWLGSSVDCTDIERLRGGMVNTVLRLQMDQPPHTVTRHMQVVE